MRGREMTHGERHRVTFGSFQIPMRGRELSGSALRSEAGTLPNPHAGSRGGEGCHDARQAVFFQIPMRGREAELVEQRELLQAPSKSPCGVART